MIAKHTEKKRRKQNVGASMYQEIVPFIARKAEIPDSRRMKMWEDTELVF
jgi:hypothetical protein